MVTLHSSATHPSELRAQSLSVRSRRVLDGPSRAGETLAVMDTRVAHHLMQRLNRDAERIAVRFGLRYRCIEAESANVKRRYGICYDDGSIRIRLAHIVSGHPLKYSSLVDTLCHELAHLRHFNHGPAFKAFYQRLLAWARKERIYRPGRDPLDPGCLAERTLGDRASAAAAVAHSRPAQAELSLGRVDWRASGKRTRTAAAPARPAQPSPRPPEQLSLF